MTSKERAALRAKGHVLEPLFQVGKGGVTDALIEQTNDALKARELIKLKVLLETSPKKPKEVANEIACATGAEVVSVVGGSMIFYRYSKELHDKEKQKQKNIREAAKYRKQKQNEGRREQRFQKYGRNDKKY